ncbi:Na(+)/H(+) antiporter subunit C [Corynebacterium sp. TAE3-ERU12]|uniref:Na(+)/H(+) antiporter subunit C n=1 Tax=Corynebacterium sp. TAE3-ERU12 TaxID=2849491 RepID=UPI001C4817E5|nr:Na(+)/H(+) antiporter subunit C [Corynebacterium sp. TAE3-ERU12]MBV7295956.1 Na(+)/H(+) antiporter subunit C [Corynebacterium sp. TAE3-ERU12]
MIINFTLLATAGVLLAAGTYLLLDRAITRMLMGLLLMGNGINVFILATSGPPGKPPIRGHGPNPSAEVADPLPQALILTAIVIMLGLSAFILALAYRQHRYRAGDHIQDDREDRALAARRADDPSLAPDHDRSDDPTTGKPTGAGDQFGPESFEKPLAKGADDDDD